MFLTSLTRRNPQLVAAAVDLHQAGLIPANSYVLDLDAIENNTSEFASRADKLGLTAFAMSKQLGRVPPVLAAIVRGGIHSFVAVDTQGARLINVSGHRVGHLGHLVQVPEGETDGAMRMVPDYWTVFSVDKARAVSDAATALGRTQKVLLRVHREGDTFYEGHEGGIELAQLADAYQQIDALDGLDVAGVTTFPALLFSQDRGTVHLTPNMQTVVEAAQTLRDLGMDHVEVNAPGTTSSETLELLADAGATQVEPGHGLTATTPLHAVRDLPEVPAVLYLSEVSHIHEGRAYVYGGGTYIDPVFGPYQVRALVGHDGDHALSTFVDASLPPYEAIDYYAQLHPGDATPRVGDSVVFGFRIQAFVTRAYIVPVAGLADDRPQVAGIWTAAGAPAQWP